MKSAFCLKLLPLIMLGVTLLTPSCTTSGASSGASSASGSTSGRSVWDPGYGPFDPNGNYQETQADDPARQHRRPGFNGGALSAASEHSSNQSPSSYPASPQPTYQPVSPPRTVYNPAPVSAPQTTTYTPAPAPTPPKPTVTSSSTRSHKVQAGDTLYGLSRKYSTSVSAIQKANKLSGTVIRKGQVLKIP